MKLSATVKEVVADAQVEISQEEGAETRPGVPTRESIGAPRGLLTAYGQELRRAIRKAGSGSNQHRGWLSCTAVRTACEGRPSFGDGAERAQAARRS